jgi:hypothetical protein
MPRGFDRIPAVRLEDIHSNEIWVAFRSSAATEDELYASPPLAQLATLGYRPVEIHDIQTPSESAYLIKLVKE